MTVQQPTAATARPAPQAATEVGPVGDRSLGLRRRLAFAILIVYALLMFIPFAWTVITSFKTQPDSVQMTPQRRLYSRASVAFVWTRRHQQQTTHIVSQLREPSNKALLDPSRQ